MKNKDKYFESKNRFLNRFNAESNLNLLYFHSFLCPIASAEATVQEKLVEDYDALELLVLRLYDAGFHNIDDLTELSGMQKELIERALDNEINVYHHIEEKEDEKTHKKTCKITDMGSETIEVNKNISEAKNLAIYSTPRRLQIEAVTGTVIPAYLETKIERLRSDLDENVDGIIPKESVKRDEDLNLEIRARLETNLNLEIRTRLEEYKKLGIIESSDIIVDFDKIKFDSKAIYYRWSYIAKFEGMAYPMIVMDGLKSIDRINRDSIAKGDYGYKVTIPLAISKSDQSFFEQHGVPIDDILVREDDVFQGLLEKSTEFNFNEENYESEEIDVSEAVYEDELIMDEELTDELSINEKNEENFTND